jgi:hypothetical protein
MLRTLLTFLLLLVVVEITFSQVSGEMNSPDSSKILPATIQYKGRMTIIMAGLNFTAQFIARVAGEDSTAISFFGPMGVLLGKVFANKDYFQYYETLHNWAVVGKSDRKNIQNASTIPLAFVDFIRLFEGKACYPKDSLTLVENSPNGKILFAKKDIGFIDFFLYTKEDFRLIQFQKKNSHDQIVLNILYPEYTEFNGYRLPSRYIMQVTEGKGSVTIEIQEVSFNITFDQPFSFQIPKSAEVYKYFD